MRRLQIIIRLETPTESISGANISEIVRNILIDELPIELEHENIIHEFWESNNES